jgi:hypothetical protein
VVAEEDSLETALLGMLSQRAQLGQRDVKNVD